MEPLPNTPSFRLDGRRALVTGAGRGIGLAAAAALAEAGAHVVLAARTRSEIEEAAAAIRERGGAAEALVLDVTDVVSAQSAVAAQAPFNVLVNNAGGNRPTPFLDVSIEDFDHIMSLNVRSAYFLAQAVAKRMVESGTKGAIINVSSQMAYTSGPNRTVYCASKSAMEGFSRAMGVELAPHGIRVNTLCPTFIETPLARGFLKDNSLRAHVLSKIKLGRIGQVEDLMGAIVFMASDASSLMTSTHLLVDGGWTAA